MYICSYLVYVASTWYVPILTLNLAWLAVPYHLGGKVRPRISGFVRERGIAAVVFFVLRSTTDLGGKRFVAH